LTEEKHSNKLENGEWLMMHINRISIK